MVSMTDQELDGFLAQCCQQLEQRQTYLVQEFGIGQCSRFDLNLLDGLLTGHDDIGIYFRAEVTPIGFYSRTSREWRWAWAMPDLPLTLQERAAPLKMLTERTGLNLFQADSFETDEDLVLEMTAMACQCLQATGCYQAEASEDKGDRYLMLALTSIYP